MSTILDERIEDYIRSRDRLRVLTEELFPAGVVVRVKRNGNLGFAIRQSGEYEAGMIPVYHESGNIWEVAATWLEIVDDKTQWHPWIIRELAKRM